MTFFLGAYATSPCASGWDEVAETAYMDGLKSIPRLRGLEYPFTGRLHPHDDAWLLRSLDPDWELVLTLLPGTMDKMAGNPRFGLASTDEAGRREAIAFTRAAREVVDHFAGRVIAVELHSAPRRGGEGVASSAAALTESLVEIAGWNWNGARLVVEHCDAWTPEWPPIKGFLAFDEEIAAVQAANARVKDGSIGIAINWGRSVLEARDPSRPLAQIAQARAAGLLAGLMFSGCSGEDTPWGVWQDSHMPHAAAAAGSLMTAAAMAEALAAAGHGLTFVGGKLTARPSEATLDQRIALNRDLLRVLAGL